MRISKTIRPKNITPSTDVVVYPRIKISNYELQSIRAASLESPRQLGEVLLPYCIIMATMRSIHIDDGCFATLDPKFKRTYSVRNRFEAKNTFLSFTHVGAYPGYGGHRPAASLRPTV